MTTREHDDDRVAQYVAGTLSAGEVEEFEQHLLSCETCRAAVRLGAVTRAALMTEAREETTRPLDRTRGSRRRPVWFVAAAAAVVLIVLTMRDDPAGDALGMVAPAPFTPGAVRPSMDSATALVDSGMAAYSAANFGVAAEQLARATRVDSSAAVRFFLGVSLLMQGDEAAAVRSLQRIPPDSPYGDEAAYYEAKALVRMSKPDSAIAVLERAATTGARSDLLRAFADSLRRR